MRTFIAILVLVLFSGTVAAAPAVRPPPGAKPAARPVPRPVPAPPMAFYVVKGAPDACGPGCDTWIAAEGQIDAAAAARFKKFLTRVRDRKLPIYFSSPGGHLDQALAMGAMLRERPVVARVARTVVQECGFEAQNGAACLKLKQSGRDLHGNLWTRNASCASACPYLMLGAATREIAPDAVLAVHSPKVVTHFRGGVPTPQMRAEANARGIERADHMLVQYIARMGGEPGLLVLARRIKYEDMHILTRDEIVSFGIDRRDFVETPWIFENVGRSMVYKSVVQRRDGDGSFRLKQWRLVCFHADGFELGFQRPAAADGRFSAVSISNGTSNPVYLSRATSEPAGVELWGVRMNRASVETLAGLPQFDLTGMSPAIVGRRSTHSMKVSGEGFSHALESLLAACPARSTPLLQAVGLRDRAVK